MKRISGRKFSAKQKLKRRLIIRLFTAMIIYLLFRNFTCPASAEEKINKGKYYTSIEVVQGDTLNDIASRYISPEYKNISEYVDEVRQMNYLGYDYKIHAGEYIVIPYYAADSDDI